MIRFTFEQGRVIGAMIEKAMTTPANYPMSLNAVMIACNQVSNREPVTQLTEDTIELILRGLADDGLVKMVHRPGDRVVKYRQALDDELGTSAKEIALLGVLLLRGSQTPGELRQRTTRYVEFVSLPELEETLAELARRGMARRLDRQPGQKESRYEQLLTNDGEPSGEEPSGGQALPEQAMEEQPSTTRSMETAPNREQSPAAEPVNEADRGHGLKSQLDDLKRRFEELLDRLGEEIP